VSTTDLLERKSSCSGLENRDYGSRGPAVLATRQPLYPQKLALTLPTSNGRSVGIVHSLTQATEYFNIQLCVIKVEVNFSLSTMAWKSVGEWCTDLRFLDLDTNWRWVVSLTLMPLHPWYSSDTMLGGSHGQTGRYRPVNIRASTRIRIRRLCRPACS
jgi:hypothetical protein